MKFCPQCGTTFESGARFCLECGFDSSTVEMVDEIVSTGSENVPDVTETHPVEPSVDASMPNVISPVCSQCGSALVPEDRFCQECGFDKSALSATVEAEVLKPVEPIIVEETFVPPAAVEQPVSPPVNKQFCAQCGFSFDSGDRFCPDCGFDTQAPVVAKATVIPPVVQPVPPPPALKPAKPEPAYVPPSRQKETTTQPRKKKTWLWLLIAILALGALGAAGWYGYNNYFNKSEETPVDTTANQVISDIPAIDTTMVTPEVTEQPTIETNPEQQKATTKPLSRIDQELAKQKAKQQQGKPAQPSNTPAQQTKPDQGIKITSIPTNPAGNDKMAKVIMEVGKKEEPKSKNPKNPTKLMIQKPTMIVRITTDHYNNGMGTSGGGTISIKDRDGNSFGSFRASGKTGKDGTPNAKWVATPHIILDKGTYFIWDSDVSTWSKNFVGNGFVVVEGYEVE